MRFKKTFIQNIGCGRNDYFDSFDQFRIMIKCKDMWNY